MKVGEIWKLKIGKVFVKITDIVEDEIYYEVISVDIDEDLEKKMINSEEKHYIYVVGEIGSDIRDIFIKMYEKVYD